MGVCGASKPRGVYAGAQESTRIPANAGCWRGRDANNTFLQGEFTEAAIEQVRSLEGEAHFLELQLDKLLAAEQARQSEDDVALPPLPPDTLPPEPLPPLAVLPPVPLPPELLPPLPPDALPLDGLPPLAVCPPVPLPPELLPPLAVCPPVPLPPEPLWPQNVFVRSWVSFTAGL